jgi:hypothetical protein
MVGLKLIPLGSGIAKRHIWPSHFPLFFAGDLPMRTCGREVMELSEPAKNWISLSTSMISAAYFLYKAFNQDALDILDLGKNHMTFSAGLCSLFLLVTLFTFCLMFSYFGARWILDHVKD